MTDSCLKMILAIVRRMHYRESRVELESSVGKLI